MIPVVLVLLLPGAVAAPIGNLEVFTAFPTDVGVRGTLEGPGRVRLTGSAGRLPQPYLDAINNTATARGWYDDHTAGLIDTALQDAVVLRAHLGWRPIDRLGFQFEAGFGWMGLGGGLTSAEVLEAMYGYDLSAWLGNDYSFLAEAVLRRAEGSVGWEHVIGEHILVRWDLGVSYTVNATARVDRNFDAGWLFNDALDDLEDGLEDDLEDALEKVHTPILALGIGWRFP